MSKPDLLTVEVVYDIEVPGGFQTKRRRFQVTPERFNEMRTAAIRKKYLPGWAYITGAIWRTEYLMGNEVTITYLRVRVVQKTGPRTPWHWYAIYNAKTDELLATGTAEQCAKAMGFKSPSTIYQLLSRTRNGINRKYRVIAMDSTPEDSDG